MNESLSDELVKVDDDRKIHEKIEGTTAGALMKMEFPEMRWVIEPFLPEGVTILAGKPKEGKSVAATNICLGVALGGKALGKNVERGGALYLHLEDNQRRLQQRIGAMLPYDDYTGCCAEAPDNLHLYYKWPRIGEGGFRALCEFLDGEPDIRIVVIDTLKKIQGESSTNRSKTGYDHDYEKVEPFREISEKFNVAVVIVHHTRKMGADDPIDLISGTLGLTGGVDNFLIMRDRQGNRAKLHAGGRDINAEEYTIEYTPETWTWNMLGKSSLIMASDTQQSVLNFIQTETFVTSGSMVTSGTTVGLPDILSGVGVNKNYLKNKIIPRLQEDGLIIRESRGHYRALLC